GLTRVDPSFFPETQLRLARAAVVAARHKRRFSLCDPAQRGNDVLAPAHPRRVARRTDQDEVVVHYVMAVDAEAAIDEGELCRGVMHEDHVTIAVLGNLERLAGSDSDDADLNAGVPGEGRQQMAEEPGFLGRGRRRHGNERLPGSTGQRCGQEQQACCAARPQPSCHAATLLVARPARYAPALMARTRASRMMPRARARARSPRLVSRAIAVVIVRVIPAMLPPTIKIAPTSAAAR